MRALYLLFLPPLLLSGSPDDRCRCPCDRLRRRRPYPPTVDVQASSAPSPLPHITYLSIFLSVALGIASATIAYLFKCIACHCRHLLYLPLSYAAYIIIYIIQQLALRLVSQ